MQIPILTSSACQRWRKIVPVSLLILTLAFPPEAIVWAQEETEAQNDAFNTLYLPTILQPGEQENDLAGQTTDSITTDTLNVQEEAEAAEELEPAIQATETVRLNRVGSNDDDPPFTKESLDVETTCAGVDSCANQLYLPLVLEEMERSTAHSSSGPQPPVVNAGVDQTITLVDPVVLRPRVTDDGLPAGLADLSATWSQVSGPAPVQFDNNKEMLTVARFSSVGTYTLRLTVRDGTLSAQDTINIVVNANHAATLRVPQEYATIQAAVNAAPARALILVAPGTYTESLVISKTVTVASTFYTTGDASLINQTVIQGTSPDVANIRVTSAAGLETQVIGFRITGGKDGIDVEGNAKIRHNRIHNVGTDCIEYGKNNAGLVEANTLEACLDDGIDLNDAEIIAQKNLIRRDEGDGIEIRMLNHPSTVWNVIIRDNEIAENIHDGIQIIDQDTIAPTASRFVIERNLIANNLQAGIGLLDNAISAEDYRAANLLERILLLNNTIVGNNHGLSGGDNLTGVNNIFANQVAKAVKRVDGNSKLFYTMFWNNPTNNDGSILDAATIFNANPNFAVKFRLGAGSPAINAGTALLTLPNGEVIVNIPASGFAGSAPDLGRFESDLVMTLESRIAIGSDDAEQRSTGGIDLASTDLELVMDRSLQTVGLRFNSIFIPKNITIVRAYVQFKTDEVQSDPITLTVQGQASNQATTFITNTSNISSRIKTTASVAWSPPAWLTIGEAGINQRTSNIAPIIQEIINRPGWASGNSIALIITGTGHRTATAFEDSPANAPRLHIEYKFN